MIPLIADINCAIDGNLNSIGNCIILQSFGADFILFGIILFIVVALILLKARAPASMVLAAGVIVAFLLRDLNPVFNILFNLAIVAIAGLLGMAILSMGRGR